MSISQSPAASTPHIPSLPILTQALPATSPYRRICGLRPEEQGHEGGDDKGGSLLEVSFRMLAPTEAAVHPRAPPGLAALSCLSVRLSAMQLVLLKRVVDELVAYMLGEAGSAGCPFALCCAGARHGGQSILDAHDVLCIYACMSHLQWLMSTMLLSF